MRRPELRLHHYQRLAQPLPLSMSTLRFTSPAGGFTHAAPVHSLACSSCGFIHNFIDIRPGPVP